ncbi:hypothetical protein, partial [Pseudomonas caricapapayae]|uniref:hypothetical protein n=1 Tax=Pseudomonas caricapapayae TaxID=46678 RepID=UPI001CC21B84
TEPPCDAERHELDYHAERGNENLSRTPTHLTSQNRRATQQNSHSDFCTQSPRQTTGKKKPTRYRIGFQ